MTITAPALAEPDPPLTPAELAENMLGLLRQFVAARKEHPLPFHDRVLDRCTEALVILMYDQEWPRGMALEAINHAMEHGTTLREAMYACQTG